VDEDGNPIKGDSKAVVTMTAFCIGIGAVALRMGGRAALLGIVGLNFADDNPGLKEQLDQVLQFSDSVDPNLRIFFFLLAWIGVKTLCFDVAGIALAFSSGILFGGVLQGALLSALCATVGSAVCFGLAKIDTPVRKKALNLVEENPSLRGIDRVVAEDGFKAILTLRLAPILPIPLGMYNYLYGVTNVPFQDFFAGIFLGSIKPYLLDSYLGYFGKSVLDGTAGQTGLQDVLVLLALGLSVMVGTFASQLAGETWEAVLEEVEEAEKNKKEDDDGVKRKVFGRDLPKWMIDLQIRAKASEERMTEIAYAELDAKVWNYTKEEKIPEDTDPACAANSPEVAERMMGVDVKEALLDGFILTPVIMGYYDKLQDPLYNEEEERANRPEVSRRFREMVENGSKQAGSTTNTEATVGEPSTPPSATDLLGQVESLRDQVKRRLQRLDEEDP